MVEDSQVTRAQPAVFEGFVRGALVAVVALHDVGALGVDLADAVLVRVADLDLDAGDGLADVAALGPRLALGDGQRRGGFGQAVALRQMQAQALEELLGLLGQRRRAADEEADVSAQAVVDLPEEDPTQVQAGLLSDGPVQPQRRVEARGEELAALLNLTADAALQQLPQRGDTHHAGDATFLQAVGQALAVDLVQVHDAGTAGQRQHEATGELEGVVQRQHRQLTPRRAE